MFPRPSKMNLGNVTLRNSESAGNGGLGYSITNHFSNLLYLPICKFTNGFPARSGALKYVAGMLHILRASTPFEIIQSIVRFLTIDMIALWFRWIDSNKCYHYQSMDLEILPSNVTRSATQANILISRFADSASQYSWSSGVIVIVAKYSPKVADTVFSFITGDCFPDLRGVITFRHFRPFYSRLMMFSRADWFKPFCATNFITIGGSFANL